jgi:glycine/D-amino acid oxidase-like deaminating enzyme
MNTDYLIIGQGLAGSLLAYTLIQRGKHAVVIDDHHRDCSTVMAAGIVNPISGKRLVLTPDFDRCAPSALKTYQELESLFAQRFYYPKPIRYFFKNKEEIEKFKRNQSCPDSSPHTGDFHPPGYDTQLIHDPLGSYTIHNGGYLDCTLLIQHLRRYFHERQCLREQKFVYDDLILSPGGVFWKDICADKVIFCEGWQAQFNPWFDWIEFNPAKGEILTLYCEAPLPDAVLNCGKWLLPVGRNTYKAGATYGWDPIDCKTTPAAREEISGALEKFITCPFQIIDQQAGVRPIAKDQIPIPFIGLHPRRPQIGIFNGLGSKGVLYAPFLSDHFADYLEKGTMIEGKFNVSKYKERIPKIKK